MAPQYRCRHDIAAAILEILAKRDRMKISHIALSANLPLDRAKKIARDMIEHGLLYFDPTDKTYNISNLGLEWLYLYRRLEEIYNPPSSTLSKNKRKT